MQVRKKNFIAGFRHDIIGRARPAYSLETQDVICIYIQIVLCQVICNRLTYFLGSLTAGIAVQSVIQRLLCSSTTGCGVLKSGWPTVNRTTPSGWRQERSKTASNFSNIRIHTRHLASPVSPSYLPAYQHYRETGARTEI